MILRTDQGEVIQTGDFNSLQMGVDMSDPSKIMYILSQGLYQRPRHSVVNELTANMVDTMWDAGKDILEKPCIVGLDDKKIWFTDFGEGISLDRMNKVISKFGASTKDKKANRFGVYGLGIKSSFAVSTQFTVESNHEGIKRTWLFTKSGTNFEISLIGEEDTDKENGTTIIIPIKNDKHEWKEAIEEVLLYFKGIIIECEGFDKFNSSKLYEGKNFYYRENSSFKNFHIVFEQVIYEIALSDIGLSYINFPFGLKFGLDEPLFPTPSKDKILLDDATKELIKQRLKDTILELNELINVKHCNLYQYLRKSNLLYTFKIGDSLISVSSREYDKLCNQLNVDKPNTDYIPIQEAFKLIPRKNSDFLTKPYKEVGRIDWKNTYSKKYENCDVNDLNNCIVVDETLTQTKIEFFKSINLQKSFVKFDRSKISLNHYKSCDGLWIGIKDYNNNLQVPKNRWRECIVAWQAEEDIVLNSLPKVSDYRQQYEEWLSKKPKKVKTSKLRIKEDDDITIRFPETFEINNSNFNMKFEPKYVKVSSLNKKFYIYSTEREEVNKLYDLWINQKNIIPIMVNKTEVYKIEKLKNCISYQEFTKGTTRYAQKWVTAYLIQNDINNDKLLQKMFYRSYSNQYKPINQISELESVFSINRKTNTSKYNKDKSLIQGEINSIVAYLNKWSSSSQDNTFVKSVVETYTKLGLIDNSTLNQWNSLKAKLVYYDLLLYVKDSKVSGVFMDQILLLKKKNEMYQRQLNKLQQELNNCKSNKYD